jgi:hypothetical protein
MSDTTKALSSQYLVILHKATSILPGSDMKNYRIDFMKGNCDE